VSPIFVGQPSSYGPTVGYRAGRRLASHIRRPAIGKWEEARGHCNYGCGLGRDRRGNGERRRPKGHRGGGCFPHGQISSEANRGAHGLPEVDRAVPT